MSIFDNLLATAMMGEGGGGGGGGGDFSTAEVTVTYNALNSYYECYTPNVSGGYMYSSLSMETESEPITEPYQLVLYKNEARFFFDNGEPDYEVYTNITVTGDITVDETGIVAVSGNGTITIS